MNYTPEQQRANRRKWVESLRVSMHGTVLVRLNLEELSAPVDAITLRGVRLDLFPRPGRTLLVWANKGDLLRYVESEPEGLFVESVDAD